MPKLPAKTGVPDWYHAFDEVEQPEVVRIGDDPRLVDEFGFDFEANHRPRPAPENVPASRHNSLYLDNDPAPRAVQLPLRGGVPSFVKPHLRLDPFYSGWWVGGNEYRFMSEYSARQLKRQTGGQSLIPLTSKKTAWRKILAPEVRDLTLGVIAVAASYRTVTVDQIGCMLGRKPDKHFIKLIYQIFSAGIIELGVYGGVVLYNDAGALGVRLVKDSGAVNDWVYMLMTKLNLPEKIAVTAGRPLKPGGTYARHNVMTTEMLLRVTSYIDEIVAIGGETMSILSAVNPALGATDARRGDGVMVRDDGAQFIVETTASVTPEINKKIKNWSDVLHNAPDGSCVIFFECAKNSEYRTHRTNVLLRNRIKRHFDTALSGSWYDKTKSRMLVASWVNWFAPGYPTEAFSRLECQRYDSDTRQWVTVDLVGPNRLDIGHKSMALARSLQSTFVTPTWTRTDPYPMWALAGHRLGVDQPPLDMGHREVLATPKELAPALRRT